ncbi:MAG: VCBS repeat-containing protein, partial [Bacteroidales bacterium]|nr:VCBS repeat-containing protein [Bacteroidales bacterium]
MKTKITLFILISMSLNGFSQFGTQQIISTNVNEATSIYCADIDGDGDLDILSTSWFYDEVSWFENTDGQGAFSNKQTITSNADGADCVRAFDLDGDGDIDVLSSSYYDNTIAWYENTDGQGTFGTQQIISTDLIYGSWVYASDLDGDSDLDVISASIDDNKIAWYENTNGQGTFGSQQIIANPTQPNNVMASDLDGDGDNDILFDSAEGDYIAWCENTDGQGTFGTMQLISNAVNQPSSIYAIDIDNDGDLDVISSSIQDNKIAWYENTDGLGSFGSQQIISTNANQARYV